uniref:ATP-dependent Clp protease proteolytic subunit n=1 Tax=Aegilops tauschii TaxID=37682 RepID=N1QVE9_AEGTA
MACRNSRIAAVICSGVRTRADGAGAEGAIAPEDASTPNAGTPAVWGSSTDEDAGGGGLLNPVIDARSTSVFSVLVKILQLVPAVTELIVAQLMYLDWMNSSEPAYIYINSTGTARDDGEPVGMETEGFAIYDAMMRMKTEVHTLCIGAAAGHACLVLSAGKKGKRYMFPHAKALIQQPRIPSYGMMQASDVVIRAKEVVHNRNTLVKLLARHTGNPPEKIDKVMRGPFYMDSLKAKEFGVIDKILWRGQEKYMSDMLSPEDWDKVAGVRGPGGM